MPFILSFNKKAHNMQRIYTVEELMLDDSFLSYCIDKNSPWKSFWEKEIELYSTQKAIFAEARYTIILLHGKLDDNEVNRQVEKIKKMVSDQEKKHSSAEKLQEPVFLQSGITKQFSNSKSAKYFRKTYVVYGMVALVLVFAGGYFLKYATSKTIMQQPKPAEVSYNSNIGERKSIQLPDGSVAVLNSNSSITFAGDFNQNERSIVLSGEAFFRVAKNPAKPFIVHSGAFYVTAIGTAFYVHARNKEQDYKVDLLEGKVRLASNENKKMTETILQPGEEGAWQSSKMSFTKTFSDSTVLKQWISGKLSFKNLPVEKVLELLQQWYGVDIRVKHKKWEKITLTGDYDNKPLDHVLKIICFSISAGYSYSGNQVIIE
jgi:transmembrane sensor